MNIEVYLENQRKKVNEALEEHFSTQKECPPKLKEAMVYSLRAGGKRIRPILTIAACEACGGESLQAMPVALCLEMIHTFSLIHDDLPAMDNDDLRRGKPTNHKIFGEGFAILAGDGLLAEAFYLLSRSNVPLEVLRDIAQATGPSGMVGGQVLDLLGEGASLSAEDLEKIHRYKTGQLIRVAVTSGAKMAKATPLQLEAMRRYGEKIGLAFQVADDVLNVEGSEQTTGKSVGSDQNKKKATYPSILGLEASKRKANELMSEAIDCLRAFDRQVENLRQIARYIVLRTS